jgi:hypothetical protein
MINKKCNRCGKKIRKKFDYCPWCGHSFKPQKERSNFGMIGREDRVDGNLMMNELKLPFGLNKMMGSLIKQLEKELGNLEEGQQKPKGIKIQFGMGTPGNMNMRTLEPQTPKKTPPKFEGKEVSEKEMRRRAKLPKLEAESKLKRIGDEIIFELAIPNVRSREDIELNKIEKGIELRAYTKDACYIKTLPIKTDNLKFSIRKDKVIVENRE